MISSLKRVLKNFSWLVKIKRRFWTRKRSGKFLRLLNFVPDRVFLFFQYKNRLGRYPSIKNPVRFTEKLLWYKLNWHDPTMTICADKWAVRQYVAEKGLSHILNEMLFVYDNAEQIDFDALPNEFIIKTNNGDGTNLVCLDKVKLDFKKAKETIKEYLEIFSDGKGGTFSATRSWSYRNICPKIVVERLLSDPRSSDTSIYDYKFLCFNGRVEFYWLDCDRYTNHRRAVFDRNGSCLDIQWSYQRIEKPALPENIEEMIETAEILAEDFPFVRVDLYNIEGKIYFGELTFYEGGGYPLLNPDSIDFDLGDKFVLPKDSFSKQ